MLSPGAPMAQEGRAGRWRLTKIAKYASGSVIATVCSEVMFVVMYGALDTSTTWASVVGWLSGALPNYWLNRHWTWGRRGRPDLKREVLPYTVIVLTTLLLATLMTGALHPVLTHLEVAKPVRVTLVATAFLSVYGLMFVLKFLLFERLFRRLEGRSTGRQEVVVD